MDVERFLGIEFMEIFNIFDFQQNNLKMWDKKGENVCLCKVCKKKILSRVYFLFWYHLLLSTFSFQIFNPIYYSNWIAMKRQKLRRNNGCLKQVKTSRYWKIGLIGILKNIPYQIEPSWANHLSLSNFYKGEFKGKKVVL